jgi:hypothetical protein
MQGESEQVSSKQVRTLPPTVAAWRIAARGPVRRKQPVRRIGLVIAAGVALSMKAAHGEAVRKLGSPTEHPRETIASQPIGPSPFFR